jgi:hypothetical protein
MNMLNRLDVIMICLFLRFFHSVSKHLVYAGEPFSFWDHWLIILGGTTIIIATELYLHAKRELSTSTKAAIPTIREEGA